MTPKYTTYQLHQFLIKLNKRLRSVDQSANISVIEKHEYAANESVLVGNEHREVVMKVVVTVDSKVNKLN